MAHKKTDFGDSMPPTYVPDEMDVSPAPWTEAEKQKITMVLETMVESGELVL